METPALHDAAEFHRRVITQFAELIDACNERFIAKWEAQAARGELVNVTDDMSELTLEIVLLSIFGTDLERLVERHGDNPFDIVTKESKRDLKFAYQFRQSRKLVGDVARAAPRRANPSISISCRCCSRRATRKPARQCPNGS